MCHELGHGLGLGHSDENFHNKDLGNCMDYTERPQNNMSPDGSNFETLEELYGNVNGVNVRMERLSASSSGGGGRRMARSSREEEERLEMEFEEYAAYLLEPIETSFNINRNLVHGQGEDEEDDSAQRNWRVLHRTDTHELHERNLGNGYTIRSSILLA